GLPGAHEADDGEDQAEQRKQGQDEARDREPVALLLRLNRVAVRGLLAIGLLSPEVSLRSAIPVLRRPVARLRGPVPRLLRNPLLVLRLRCTELAAGVDRRRREGGLRLL